MGYQYYPVDIGHYVVYDVVEIEHDEALNLHDTDTYQIKEFFESTFTDNEGNESVRLERLRRDSVTGPWVIADVWYTTRLPRRAEKIEENKRILKLIFAPNEGEAWDGNVYNTDDEWEYVIRSVHAPTSIGGFSLDSTCTVVERDFRPGVLFHEYSSSTYATNIGLVRTWRKVIEMNGSDTTSVTKGYELYMTLNDHN